jgi:hypothetical protein
MNSKVHTNWFRPPRTVRTNSFLGTYSNQTVNCMYGGKPGTMTMVHGWLEPVAMHEVKL